MEITELRNFISVVRAGSFAAAAEETGVPRSTLSKRIQMLETSLGLRLIERSTRKLRLTADGELLLPRALQLAADADDLERLMRDRSAEPSGRLRVSVPMMLGQELLGELVASYTAQWPETEVDIVFTDRRSDLIEEGFDCAIRIGPLEDSDLIARPLARSRTILVASPIVMQEQGYPEEPEDILERPTISFSPSGKPVPWVLEQNGERVDLTPQSKITLGSLHAVRAASIAGGGIALIPALIAMAALAEGSLVQIMPKWQGPASAINIVYPSRRHVSARLRAFIDLTTVRLEKIVPTEL
ncbi:HTH-type transcriptional regulator AbgR [Maritalea myrionectae]|uniref:HTH-type transcriptional regulator AbgR n=1 Tax=Maritalea myrionectae TaxID=454601 RepID=A0A2R4MG24_9HYPH|nr:LysR family transcriptional regulator [Maritalea myrionectae]AVX04988.1 HTH-type transcriptional regulator AbgR [Maritalea myrionectae]